MVALLSIFGNISMSTASWLLDCLRIVIELALTHGINPLHSPTTLRASDLSNLSRIPKTITTVISWLKIDPFLIEINCCQACFALYPLERTPTNCTHRTSRIPGGPPDQVNTNTHTVSSGQDYVPDISEFSERTCGQFLTKISRGKCVPVRKFAFQSLSDWIARLLSRPEIESLLDNSLVESRKPFDPNKPTKDINETKIWKTFKGPDGKQFTATSGHLTFGMFIDAINPYGNKTSGHHASITFIVMVCLTLPLDIRHRPENVFVVGIAPGPSEPSLEQMNWLLLPVVNELKTLWKPGLLLLRTHLYKFGRLVRAALLIFIADIPALRRSLGFPSARARFFCSKCLITKDEIKTLDKKKWSARTCAQHKLWAFEARDSKTVEDHVHIFKTHGVRYSVLVELEYWDIIDYHVVDSMHNLLLGLLAWNVQRFWAMKDENNANEGLDPITNVEL